MARLIIRATCLRRRISYWTTSDLGYSQLQGGEILRRSPGAGKPPLSCYLTVEPAALLLLLRVRRRHRSVHYLLRVRRYFALSSSTTTYQGDGAGENHHRGSPLLPDDDNLSNHFLRPQHD